MPKRSFAPAGSGRGRRGPEPDAPHPPTAPAVQQGADAQQARRQDVPERPAPSGPTGRAPQPAGVAPRAPGAVPQPQPQQARPQAQAQAPRAPHQEPPQSPHPQAPHQPPPPKASQPPPKPSLPPSAHWAGPGPRAVTSSELTEYTIVRRRSDRPGSGWRRAVHVASGGVVNPGIGPAEQHRQELALRVRRPLPGPRQVAVVSMKGGVGKTTVTALLGLVLAEHRGDRVIALDANPDAGTLADRLTGKTDSTVRDLLDSVSSIGSLSDVGRFTTLSGRLQVLASEQDPARSEAFDRAEYERVCAVLARFYDIVVTDSGTGMVHSAMDGTLALANGIVVVGSLTVDAASRASRTLDWLVAHGHGELVRRAVVVLNGDRSSREVEVDRMLAHFRARCRAVVVVPRDPHLATGGRIELDALRLPTSDAALELAALVADDLAAPSA